MSYTITHRGQTLVSPGCHARYVLVIALFVLIVAALACSRSDGDREAETPPELSSTAIQLLASLEQGTRATYRAAYRVRTSTGTPGDTFIVSNKPPRTNVGTIPVSQFEDAMLVIGGTREQRTLGCARGRAGWECVDVEPFADSLLKAAGPVPFLTEQDLADTQVRLGPNRRVAGQDAQCFVVASQQRAGDRSTEYCLNSTGVVLYCSTPSQTIEATMYSSQVSSSDFRAPDEP